MLVILRVHILADVTSYVSPYQRGLYLWTSTVRETETGYRLKAYTIF